MIKLLNRKPRARKRPLTAAIVLHWDYDAGRPIYRELSAAEAEQLWHAAKLQKLDMGRDYTGLWYGPRRSFRQMLHNEWPPHHPDVLALIAKHENATGANTK